MLENNPPPPPLPSLPSSSSSPGPPIITVDATQHAIKHSKGKLECRVGSSPPPDKIVSQLLPPTHTRNRAITECLTCRAGVRQPKLAEPVSRVGRERLRGVDLWRHEPILRLLSEPLRADSYPATTGSCLPLVLSLRLWLAGFPASSWHHTAWNPLWHWHALVTLKEQANSSKWQAPQAPNSSSESPGTSAYELATFLEEEDERSDIKDLMATTMSVAMRAIYPRQWIL
ncbi:kin of IRRE-like protein 2 isoform X2 [Lates japonicus]|uniref:Kin of IRRE-like protein 2 isoform X2 n=1 Tax=Lates japonicus TaxID=270547 RepID=A0AAD3N128_LATJO|nr:kin of IRRE-like protein 2 isoform X2 [Lates japonicus]